MTYLLRLSACLFVLFSFNAFAVDTDGDGFSDAGLRCGQVEEEVSLANFSEAQNENL